MSTRDQHFVTKLIEYLQLCSIAVLYSCNGQMKRMGASFIAQKFCIYKVLFMLILGCETFTQSMIALIINCVN